MFHDVVNWSRVLLLDEFDGWFASGNERIASTDMSQIENVFLLQLKFYNILENLF